MHLIYYCPLGGIYLMGPAFLFILGVTSLFTAYGLYRGKNWSWKLLLVLSGFGAAGYLLNVVNGQFISIIGVSIIRSSYTICTDLM